MLPTPSRGYQCELPSSLARLLIRSVLSVHVLLRLFRTVDGVERFRPVESSSIPDSPLGFRGAVTLVGVP
jgi:hypothetical protein